MGVSQSVALITIARIDTCLLRVSATVNLLLVRTKRDMVSDVIIAPPFSAPPLRHRRPSLGEGAGPIRRAGIFILILLVVAHHSSLAFCSLLSQASKRHQFHPRVSNQLQSTPQAAIMVKAGKRLVHSVAGSMASFPIWRRAC